MPFRASQLVIWLLVCLVLTAAVFFLALRLYFQKSLNLFSGDISVCRGAGSRPLRLGTLYHVTPNNAPPTTTTSSMVTRSAILKFESYQAALSSL